MRRGIALPVLLVVLFSCLTFAGCRATAPHPPEFKHVIAAQRDLLDNPMSQRWARLFAAMRFTDEDLAAIRRRGHLDELVGAGVQSEGETALDLLWAAVERSPREPYVLAAFAQEYLSLDLNQPGRTTAFDEKQGVPCLRRVLREFHAAAPGNAAVDCWTALELLQEGDREAASEAIKRAAEKPVFDTCACAGRMRRAVVRAAEAAGYSKFTARYYALGQTGGVWLFGRLCLDMMQRPAATDEDIRNCLALGERIERSAGVMLESLFGLRIQLTARQKQTGKEAQEDIRAVNARIASLRELAETVRNLTLSPAIGEERWTQYLDEVLAGGEADAIRKLAAETGPRPGP